MFSHRRITLYVLRQLAMPTFLGLCLYTFVLLMNHFFLVAEKSLTKKLGFELTARLFLVGVPPLLVLSIPMAFLLGTLVTLGRLSEDHEWVALQAAGWGPAVLFRPVFLHGLTGAILSFVIYGFVVPETNYALRALRGEVLFASNLAADLRPRVFYDLQDDAVFFVDEIRPGGERRLENVIFIQPSPRDGSTQLYLAKSGDLYPATDRTGALMIDLFDGEARLYRSDPDADYQLTRFKRITRRLEPPDFVRALLGRGPPERVVQDLDLREVFAETRTARAELHSIGSQADARGKGIARARLRTATVELHQRFALPLASLFFALLALPLGIRRVRSGKGAGFAISLVVIVLYRVVFVVARNQAAHPLGKLPPGLGVWLANLLVLGVACAGLWRLRRAAPSTGPGLLGGLLGALRRLPARRGAEESGTTDVEAVAGIQTVSGTTTRFVGRLDRYIGMTYLRVLFLAVASAYVVFALVELQGLTEGLLRSGGSLSLVPVYFKYFAPGVLHMILPISCLIGAIVAFTLLARTSELVAIIFAGIGLRRVTLPVLFLTLLLCALQFLVEDRIAPASNRRAQEIKDQILGHPPRTHGLPATGRWSFSQDGQTLYHYRHYDPEHGEFRDLSVFGIDRSVPTILDHRFSRKARWSEGAWEMEQGWVRTFSPDSHTIHAGVERVELPRAATLLSGEQPLILTGGDLPEQLSLLEIRQQIATLKNSGYDITQLRVAYHGKFSHAVAPLVMVLLGLPFAFKVGRHGSLYAVGVALLLVIVYWAAFAVFNALGLETLLRPLVAAWAPNVLFGLIGAFLMLYVKT